MEVVAATASVAALAELALKTHHHATRLVRSFNNAPRELTRVLQHLEMLKCELALLSDIERQISTKEDVPLLSAERAQIESALVAASDVISNIHGHLGVAPDQTQVRVRLRWALKSKQQVEDCLGSLKHVQSSLHTVLLLINIRLSSYSWKVALRLKDHEDKPVGTTDADELEFSCPKRSLSSLFDRNPQAWNSFYGSWSYNHPFLDWLGMQLSLVYYGSSLHTTFHVSGRLGLWKWLTVRALTFNLGLRVFPLTNLGFSLLRGSLMLRNVVSETSDIMASCARGDVSAVKALFISGKASPYDMTISNSSPLRYAIESGSLQLVQFLCHHEADVNSAFGERETSPLEWAFMNRQLDITRYLLSQGARLDYLSLRGWTPVMLLFFPSHDPVPAEYFDVLVDYSFSDYDVQDITGTTVLHRAALWGTAEDVGRLLKVGASPTIADDIDGWTPIFQAASVNNVPALTALAQGMLPSFVDDLDFEGRTILHVAIEAGGVEALRFLIESGADMHRKVRVQGEGGVTGMEVSPTEYAWMKGRDKYEAFIQALRLTGVDVSTVDEDGVVFWPAEDSG